MSSTNPIPLFANPGQTVVLTIQTVDSSGARVDGYTPTVMEVLFPDLSAATGFPVAMTRVGTGLYTYQLSIPSGTSGLGTFTVSTRFTDPSVASGVKWDVFSINVSLPFGNSSVTPL